MQFIKRWGSLAFFLLPFFVKAQSTYMPRGTEYVNFIDRLQIKAQRDSVLNLSSDQPYDRRFMIRVMEQMYRAGMNSTITDTAQLRAAEVAYLSQHLSAVDLYNLRGLMMMNPEWLREEYPELASKRKVFNALYADPTNFYTVSAKDFFFQVNPLLNLQYMKEKNNDQNLFVNTRGLEFRGRIANKIGFYTLITDNQERSPSFVQDWINEYRASPGYNFYKTYKGTKTDYFDARGYITFEAAKYLQFQFGYDKNFIGNGYRSLFLSDFGGSYPFLKVNLRIWKFNYENIWAQLTPTFVKTGDYELPRKYFSMHHLSVNVTKWLNMGLFEGVMQAKRVNGGIDLSYVNPVIFLRAAEGNAGSPDNAVVGFDFKANAAHRFQFYGQLLIDELKTSELFSGKKWWGNKYGFQLGAKYVDVFNVKNLDLQLEMNQVRPFTYSHYDSVASYTHYNQPLAHPLGANFREFIAIANYQPIPKLRLSGRIIAYTKGLDSAGYNYGGNIFRLYTDGRPGDYGYDIGSGLKAQAVNASVNVSYEVRRNLFVDVNYLYRKYKVEGLGSTNTSVFGIGIRANLARRDYNFN